jgi:methyl-accepting chemotaxis protein
VAVDENIENNVNYEDLISHIAAKKPVYFHPRLQKDFNVGYLMGFFETKDETIDKIKKGEIALPERGNIREEKVPNFVINILNNNNSIVKSQVSTQVSIDIDVQLVNDLSSELIGDTSYLLGELEESNKVLRDALQKVMQFADEAKTAQNSGEVKEKGWSRRLKSVLETLTAAGKGLKDIKDGSEALQSIIHKISQLAIQFNLTEITNWIAQHHPHI